ncbi:MAG TPA: electron transfer flavoprotein subunit beta/FixA family protein [Chloroflexota bacterium]|nr:electron transfer flavoprotein subunit beta/FixA family protein [Chloroflexota bacterium]
MNIVVCVKQTPVTTAEKQLDEALLLDRESVDNAMNTYDEVAVEEALRLQEAHGGTVVVLTMGPDEATDTIRKALAMGADQAALVSDEALHGSDVWASALVLAAAARKLQPDLLLLGMRSDDAATGVLAGALAQHLDLPLLTNANKVEIDGDTVRIQRRLADGYIVQESTMPLVLGVTDAINTARYPSLKGIMGAKKKPLEQWSLADLDIDPATVGLTGSRTKVLAATMPPPRAKGEVFEDKGDAAERIVQFLAARKVV